MSHQAKVCGICGIVITDDMPRKSVPDISPYLISHDCPPISKWLCRTCYTNAVPILEKEIASWKAPSTLSI